MLIVGHTAIGIGIGLVTREPVAAFAAGVVSHHLADMVPHFDPGSYMLKVPWRPRGARDYEARDWLFIAIDLVATFAFLAWLVPQVEPSLWWAVGWGVLGANLPDIVHNVPFWGIRLRQIGWIRWWQEEIHRKYHWTVNPRLWHVGLATQILVMWLAVWLVERGV